MGLCQNCEFFLDSGTRNTYVSFNKGSQVPCATSIELLPPSLHCGGRSYLLWEPMRWEQWVESALHAKSCHGAGLVAENQRMLSCHAGGPAVSSHGASGGTSGVRTAHPE